MHVGARGDQLADGLPFALLRGHDQRTLAVQRFHGSLEVGAGGHERVEHAHAAFLCREMEWRVVARPGGVEMGTRLGQHAHAAVCSGRALLMFATSASAS